MNNQKLATWTPGKRSKKEQEIALKLTQTYYNYNLPNPGGRIMTFLKNGLIGEGNTSTESHWDIKLIDDYVFLEFFSKTSKAFTLLLCSDGIWRGHSDMADKNEIELTPLKAIHNTYTVSTVHNQFVINSYPRIIHVLLSGQLGNCLRNICSIKILADSIGAEWDIDLNRSISTFEVNQVISILFPDKIIRSSLDSYNSVHEEKLMNFQDIYGTNSSPLVEAVICSVPMFEFGVHHIYAARPSNITDKEYIKRKLRFYSEIEWPLQVIQKTKDFINNKAEGNLLNYIGIHIRYTDNLQDEVKCRLNLNTPLSVFLDKIGEIQQIPILLCTDNLSLREVVEEKYPKIKILYPDIFDIGSSIFQPLYEMYILSHTQHIIGSFSSTFSYEACFIKGTDLNIYNNNTWNYYSISNY